MKNEHNRTGSINEFIAGVSVAMAFLILVAASPIKDALFQGMWRADANAGGYSITNLGNVTSTNTITAATFVGSASGLTDIPAPSGVLRSTNNLSDVTSAGSSRTNIGANDAANLTTGTLPAARLPAVAVQTTRTISTTSPLAGGGDLSSDRTLTFDGTATFVASGATTLNGSNISSGTVEVARLPSIPATLFSATNSPSIGKLPVYDTGGNIGWINLPAGGSGTVTSVNVSVPNFTSGGAVTTSGTVTLTADVQNAHFALMGPGSGGAATPGYRQPTVLDLSTTGSAIAANVLHGDALWGKVILASEVSGTLPLANGGLGFDATGTGGTSRVLRQSTLGGAITVAGLNFSDLSGTPTTLSGYGIADAQPLDAELTAFAALTNAVDKVPYFNGSSMSTADFTSTARSLVAGSSTSAMRSTLGLVIGTDVQAANAGLLSIAGLTTSADKSIYTSASNTYGVYDLTAAGRANANVTGTAAANKIVYLTGTTSAGIIDFTAGGRANVNVASAAAADKIVYLTSTTASDVTSFTATARSLVGLSVTAKGQIFSCDSSGTIVVVAAPVSNGQVLTAASGSSGGVTWATGGAAGKPFVATHNTATNTAGGTGTTAAFTKRNLNTETTDIDGIGTLSSGQVTLGAGTYKVNASQNFMATGYSGSRLRDITNTATLIVGTSVYSNTVGSQSTISGVITLSGTTVIELQYYITTSNAEALGAQANTGEINVFATLEITKL